MGLRDKVLSRLKGVVQRFSGDYSAEAPETIVAYEKPGVPNDDAQVVMARLNRPPPPKGAKAKKEADET
jgi:hypothetical protein